MPIVCPNCASRNLRYAQVRNLSERLAGLIGIRPLRCRDCRTRFANPRWTLEELRYAHCPKCCRTELGRWLDDQFRPPRQMRLLLKLGARPYRCDYSRWNFVSFRPRSERSGERLRHGVMSGEQPSRAAR